MQYHQELLTVDLTKQVNDLSPERRTLLAKRLQQKAAAVTAPENSNGWPGQMIREPSDRYLPFPLTDLQQAYWIGRTGVFAMGDVACHVYLEVERANLDIDRLNLALQRLIEHHDMMRAVVLADGQQQILERVPPYEIEIFDLSGRDAQAINSHLEEVRARMSHQVIPSDSWPLFDIKASRLIDQRVRLHISLDALVFDGWSIYLFLKQWADLYENPSTPLEPLDISFRDYVMNQASLKDTQVYHQAREYWRERMVNLPPAPQLPLAKSPASLPNTRFVRRTRKLDQQTWLRLKNMASQSGLTSTGVLLAAYIDVITHWSDGPQFTINIPSFNRRPLHPQVNQLIGDFASFTLLGVKDAGQESFAIRAGHLQQQLWDDLDHDHFNGVEVLREMAQAQLGTQGSLAPVVFTASAKDKDGKDAYITTAASELGEVVFAINQTPQVWLDNHVSEQNGALVIDWDSVDELFSEGISEDMLEAYLRLLQDLADEPEAWQEGWPETAQRIMPPAPVITGHERHQLLVEWNDTQADYPLDKCLHQLFDDQVERTPDTVAVVFEGEQLTYRQLESRANQLANRLQKLGVGPDVLVGIFMERSLEMVVALLAVLKASGAYVPLDPEYPKDRIAFMLEDAAVPVLLTQDRLFSQLPEHNAKVLCLDSGWGTVAEEQEYRPAAASGPEDLAYVIYTSGSTGRPKGVMNTHRGICSHLMWMQDRYNLTDEDRVLQKTPLSFDVSVWELFLPLMSGACLVLARPGGHKDTAYLVDLITQQNITLLHFVPSMLQVFLETGLVEDCESIRQVICSGEALPFELQQRFFARLEAKLDNLYGPTEAAIDVTYWSCDLNDARRTVPIGRPVANTQIYILDEGLQPVPIGARGELHIGGLQVAKGYLNRPELTAERFIPDPFGAEPGAVLYKTGDLARFTGDGNIEYLGRMDHQVKIWGNRIELGEIEAVMRQLANLQEVVAIAREDESGETSLVAYMVVGQQPPPSIDGIREALNEKLPQYMVPRSFVILDAMPLMPNGKLDRNALPDPEQVKAESATASQPQPTSHVIGRICKLVSDVLKIEQPDPDANLVSLGANSIDMVRIGNMLEREFGARPRLDELFRLKTIGALAEYYHPGELSDVPIKEPQSQSMELATGPSGGAEIDRLIASYRVLLDPEERDAFKKKQPGIRKSDIGKPFIQLAIPAQDATIKEKYMRRRNHRSFSQMPIPFPQFSQFLSWLDQISLPDPKETEIQATNGLTTPGMPKYLYASAGGLYPVQVYLHVKRDRVENVTAGTYYHNPIQKRLILLAKNAEIDGSIHIPFINTPTFEQAAFSIFLITQLSAIAPSYGEHSLRFATLEAGIIAHLLETSALDCGIGLCQIGSIEFDRIRDLFELDDSHFFTHSLVGGLVDSGDQLLRPPSQNADFTVATAAEEREKGIL